MLALRSTIEAVIVSVARLHVTEAVVASVLATQSPSSPPPPPHSAGSVPDVNNDDGGGGGDDRHRWHALVCYGVGSVESSPKARAQFAVAEVLRSLLDPEGMEGREQDDFLNLFYERHVHELAAPVAGSSIPFALNMRVRISGSPSGP